MAISWSPANASIGNANVNIQAGRNATVTASAVLADQDIAIRAGRNIALDGGGAKPLATSGGNANATTGSMLQRDLATQAKVQPDISRDAEYLARTDQAILKNNNFDLNHVLAGEINASGKATGYHAEFAAGGAARIRPGSAVTQNADGTYSAQIDIWNPTTNRWVQKIANKGESTFFNPSWSEARITYEVSEAFKKGVPGTRFEATSPSGIKIQFNWDSANGRTTFHPLGR